MMENACKVDGAMGQVVSPSTGHSTVLETLFAGKNQRADFTRYKLVKGELCFQNSPSLNVSH